MIKASIHRHEKLQCKLCVSAPHPLLLVVIKAIGENEVLLAGLLCVSLLFSDVIADTCDTFKMYCPDCGILLYTWLQPAGCIKLQITFIFSINGQLTLCFVTYFFSNGK